MLIKNNMSPYILFCFEQRPLIKRINSNLSFGEMAKMLRLKWNQLSEEDKKIYYDKHKTSIKKSKNRTPKHKIRKCF